MEYVGLAKLVSEGLDIMGKGGIYLAPGNLPKGGSVVEPAVALLFNNIRLIGMTNHIFTGYMPQMERIQR